MSLVPFARLGLVIAVAGSVPPARSAAQSPGLQQRGGLETRWSGAAIDIADSTGVLSARRNLKSIDPQDPIYGLQRTRLRRGALIGGAVGLAVGLVLAATQEDCDGIGCGLGTEIVVVGMPVVGMTVGALVVLVLENATAPPGPGRARAGTPPLGFAVGVRF